MPSTHTRKVLADLNPLRARQISNGDDDRVVISAFERRVLRERFVAYRHDVIEEDIAGFRPTDLIVVV
jgi:hypothetical protein